MRHGDKKKLDNREHKGLEMLFLKPAIKRQGFLEISSLLGDLEA